MNPDWQDFLTRRGAILADGIVQDFGDSAAELKAAAAGTILCDLSQFGTLRVSGEEAQSFLQNLLSNDIRESSTARAQYSSFNSAKGRMLATMLVWRQGGDYLLQLPRQLCEPVRKKLAMYVLRARVKISDASNEIIVLGLSGPDAQAVLHTRFGELPAQTLGIGAGEQGKVIRIGEQRYQVNTDLPNAVALWAEFAERCRPAGSECWNWLAIRSGIPVILPQTQEQFVAQMVNFELLGGVNFKKGCYPGQEIVARMQYLGKLKRRMFLAHLDSSTAPIPGDELYSAEMEGQACGMIVNAASAPEGGYDLLAAVQNSSRETQVVHWKSLQGEPLEFLPLPYPLPDA
ncbi:MAG: folate-binding protein [Gallionella sp.]